MTTIIRFGDIAFDQSFLFADRNGEQLRFTRQERALLQVFIRHPHTLLTRERLLDALSGGGDTSDRNVDYLINRLRAKLGDSARAPKFIATQYGEGYVWIAECGGDAASDAFCVIGPVFGLDGEDYVRTERTFLEPLRRALDRRTAADQPVVLAPDWRMDRARGGAVRFTLELGFHARHGALHVGSVLRDLPGRHILATSRLLLEPGDLTDAVEGLAETLKAKIWSRLASGPDPLAALTDEPLELRVHNAGQMLSRTDQSWLESGPQIAAARAADPHNPKAMLMWGAHLWGRLLFSGQSLDDQAREAIEDDIEAVALDALPRIAGDPILSLAAAKLLFSIDRGYFELAEALADEAFAASPAFAATFALLAQLRMCRGDFEEALRFYDQGVELAEPGSEFHVFLLVLKCTALAAADRRAELEAVAATLYAVKPDSQLVVGLLFAPAAPAPLEPSLAALLQNGGAELARNLLSHYHFIGARRFKAEAHRANLLRALTSQAIRHFGVEAVPDVIWRAAPSLKALISAAPAGVNAPTP